MELSVLLSLGMLSIVGPAASSAKQDARVPVYFNLSTRKSMAMGADNVLVEVASANVAGVSVRGIFRVDTQAVSEDESPGTPGRFVTVFKSVADINETPLECVCFDVTAPTIQRADRTFMSISPATGGVTRRSTASSPRMRLRAARSCTMSAYRRPTAA